MRKRKQRAEQSAVQSHGEEIEHRDSKTYSPLATMNNRPPEQQNETEKAHILDAVNKVTTKHYLKKNQKMPAPQDNRIQNPSYKKSGQKPPNHTTRENIN